MRANVKPLKVCPTIPNIDQGRFHGCRCFPQTAALGLALTLLLLTACSSSDGPRGSANSSTTGTGTGSLNLTSVMKPQSTTLLPASATPDSLNLTLSAAAISKDGITYQPLAAGPVTSAASTTSGLAADTYKALRINVSEIDWGLNWTLQNPSPCDGTLNANVPSGTVYHGSGINSDFYYKTIDLGGNTSAFYLANPPLTGYVGDANHPFLLPAPIQIVKDGTTTVNLVAGGDHSIGCDGISLLSFASTGDITPLQEISGDATQLFGQGGIALDTRRNELAVNNALGNSVTFYPGASANNTAPSRLITGPATRLNNPSAIAFYRGAAPDGSGDQYVVASSANNSIVTYSQSSAANAAPLLAIWGNQTGLDRPLSLALHPDPGGATNLDQIWVANGGGTDPVRAYARLGTKNTAPLRILHDPTNLTGVCGIAVDNSNNQELYVANHSSNTDGIVVYNLNNLGALQSDGVTVNAVPVRTITSPALSSPCGLAVDAANNWLIVTNQLNNSIAVFPRTASGSNVPASKTFTGIQGPAGVVLANGELWVANKSGQAAFGTAPRLFPAVSDVSANATALSPFNGDYNVVFYGVDLSRGISGLGVQIPTLFARRGVASFDGSQPQPALAWKFNAETRRQPMELGCTALDTNVKRGFYGIDAQENFYAFSSDAQGILQGGFSADGNYFSGAFLDGPALYVAYGSKATGNNASYLTSDGKQTSTGASYVYAAYNNEILAINRYNTPPADDLFQTRLDIGAFNANGGIFGTPGADRNVVSMLNPMGDFAPPKTPGAQYSANVGGLPTASSYTAAPGGQFTNQNYDGIAGMISGDGGFVGFMSNFAKVDATPCPTQMGVGLGFRQSPATGVGSIKGTYYLTGVGDRLPNTPSRSIYLTMTGTLTFDGAGSVTQNLSENDEGVITYINTTGKYNIIQKQSFPADPTTTILTTNVIELYDANNKPIATAIASGADKNGKIQALIFYRDLDLDINPVTNPGGTPNATRLVGLATLRQP